MSAHLIPSLASPASLRALRVAQRLLLAAATAALPVGGCGAVGEVGGEPPAGEARQAAAISGRGTSGEVACPTTSCAGLASGSYNILSCQAGRLLVRCYGGKPRCFACKSGYACTFDNGGYLQDDYCSAAGTGAGTSSCTACNATALATGTIWACEQGASRLVRCSNGCMETKRCSAGCTYNNGGTGNNDVCGTGGSASTSSGSSCKACNATATATGAIWACEERASRLVRCANGCMETKSCSDGCTYNNGGTGNDDRCGKSKASGGSGGLRWPVSGAKISQYFACGSCDWYPWNAAWGCCLHDALDLAAPANTPIVAAAAGTVSAAGWGDVSGYYVKIDHGGGLSTYAGHMAKQPSVKAGQWVGQGDYLGPMGMTGLATGPHTHFMVRVNGAPQDPLGFLP